MQAIRKSLAEFVPAGVASNNFKAVLQLFVNMEPQLPNEDCINGLQEDLTVEMLYCDEIIRGPTTLFRLLRDYLVLKGFRYRQHPDTNKLTYGLAVSFFTCEEDREYALQQLKSLRAHPGAAEPRANVEVPVVHNPAREQENERRIAHNMSQRFKREEKFSGKLGEDILEYLKTYEEACMDYKLSEPQVLQYLHNLFDGESKRFYREKVAPSANNYGQAKNFLVRNYSSPSRQNRIRQFLQGLTLKGIIEKESCDTSEALERLRETITKYAPQGPGSFRTEEAKVEYLYNAVAGHDWAKIPLTQCYSHDPPWNFHQLFIALDTSWLQEQRLTSVPLASSSDSSTVLWESQGTYGAPRTKFKPGNKRNNYQGKDKSRLRCFNCNELGHFSMECNKPKNFVRNINALARKDPTKANQILYELCDQLDSYDTGLYKEHVPESGFELASDETQEKLESALENDSSDGANDILNPEDF